MGHQTGQKKRFRIQNLAYGGDGVVRPDGEPVVFVPRTAPGDRVEVEITSTHKRFARGRLVTVVEPSEDRVVAPCPSYERCGGCQLMHLAVDAQRVAKHDQLLEALRRIGGVEPEQASPLWSGASERYRNKVTLHWRPRPAAFGLVGPDGHTLEPLSACLLLEPRVEEAARRAAAAAVDQLSELDLQDLMVRVTRRGDVQILLRLDAPDAPVLQPWAESQEGASVWASNSKQAPVHLAGSKTVLHSTAGVEMELGPLSFAQVNTEGAEALFSWVAEQAALTGTETVLDLYAGAGAIGLMLAKQARRVVAVESVPEAARLAVANAERNALDNVEVRTGRTEDILRSEDLRADVVVLDPPRTGTASGVIEHLVQKNVRRVVYVSCNPTTLARDLKRLAPFYRLVHVRGFDLFPHSYHLEAVATLERSG